MFTDIILLFIGTFLLVCLIFSYYHQNKEDLRQEEPTLKYACLALIDRVWRSILAFLQWIDLLLIECVSYFLENHLSPDRYLSDIRESLNSACPNTGKEGKEELAKLEIIELSNTISSMYIDFWYQHVKLEDEETDHFDYHCKKGIEDALTNFYKLCTEKINTDQLALELVKQVEAHLFNMLYQKNSEEKLSTSDEISYLLNLVDGIFTRVLPTDVNSLLTSCSCCQTDSGTCLKNSSNPVRLFIYNLTIYSLFLPLIDRIAHPLYFLYNFIFIASKLGGLTLVEYLDQFDANYVDYSDATESTPVPIDSQQAGEKALLLEAIEEAPNELMVFSNLRITNVKISSKELVSSINPYIDYIILFDCLEIDHEVEKQKGNLTRFNGQTFLQRTYQVKRRFREFLSFQQKLEKNVDFRPILTLINNKPSNIQFHSTAFLNYIKSTKINENAPLVKLRRDCLENFLVQLSCSKAVNESREFCEFLGYKYTALHEVRQLLKSSSYIDKETGRVPSEKANSKAFDLNLKNFKDIFRIFMPVQAKFGQLSTHIEDVVVNDQISSKYSITHIETECNEQNHMVLKLKLDKWAAMAYDTTGVADRDDSPLPSPTNCDTDYSQLDRQIISTCIVLLFKGYFVFQTYLVSRCSFFFKSIFSKLRSIFTFNAMFRFYIHYLHSYLVGMDNDSVDLYLNSYQRFYGILAEKDLKESYQLYVQLSEQKLASLCDQMDASFWRGPLHKAAFFLCDRFELFDNLFAFFDNHNANKRLIYRLFNVFLIEVKKSKI